ncbi:MAG: hypothetical protein JO099_07055, partial [Acidobacteriia bacterium]|nr:hypothetical protein [Terriglobia bacterium]
PQLYSQAQSNPAAFHDVTTGNNIITTTCPPRSFHCTPGTVGFNAGVGYDLVTGLGSLDAHALLTAWTAVGSSTGSGNGGSGSGGSGGSGGSTTTGTIPRITAMSNAASYNQRYAPGMLLSIFGSQLSSTTQSASSVPLPQQIAGVSVTVNNLPAYLVYVSPGQLNVQIPYEVTAGSTALLKVNNNGQTSSVSFTVAAAAPGIFVDSNGAPVPNSSAAQGQTVTLFVTGAGPVSPSIADGAAPAATTPYAALPQPQQAVTVSVGGVQAFTTFLGIPSGLVGVLQINYTVPANAPLGPQPVIVTVGNVASTPATLTVLQ